MKSTSILRFIFISIFLLQAISNLIFSQEAWTLTIKSPMTEKIYDIAETPDGNYIACGRRDEIGGSLIYGFLVEVSKDGTLIKLQDFNIEDSVTFFSHIISVSDTSIVILGKIGPSNGTTELWIIHFNYNFDIIKQSRLPFFPNLDIWDYHPKFISNGNLLIFGFVDNGSALSKELFFYETNLDGDSISFALIEMPNDQLSLDFIERRNGEGYYAYAAGGFPVPPPPGICAKLSFDTNFVLQTIDSVPRILYHAINAKWLSNDSYLITGKKGYHNPSYVNMGILRLDTLDQILNENYLGLLADTNTYPGSSDNIDFRNSDTIFYSGTGNFNQYPWQTEPSWIVLNCLDSNLNLRWQSLYGGDAFYHSWDVFATSDGGCLVSASKFDYSTGVLDNDAVLIKFDKNGFYTGISNDDLIVQSVLIYPNPGQSQFKVVSNFNDCLFHIYDLSGRCFVTSTLSKGINTINANELMSGVYIYSLTINQKQIATGKWIKR